MYNCIPVTHPCLGRGTLRNLPTLPATHSLNWSMPVCVWSMSAAGANRILPWTQGSQDPHVGGRERWWQVYRSENQTVPSASCLLQARVAPLHLGASALHVSSANPGGQAPEAVPSAGITGHLGLPLLSPVARSPPAPQSLLPPRPVPGLRGCDEKRVGTDTLAVGLGPALGRGSLLSKEPGSSWLSRGSCWALPSPPVSWTLGAVCPDPIRSFPFPNWLLPQASA